MKMLQPNQQLPDMSEMMTNLFGGGGSTNKQKTKSKKDRQLDIKMQLTL